MCCCILFLRRHKHLFKPDRELSTYLSNSIAKDQLGKPEFIVLLPGVWVKSYLQEHGQLKAAALVGHSPQDE